jgi:tetratricopeptide (TPR) repeat protein
MRQPINSTKSLKSYRVRALLILGCFFYLVNSVHGQSTEKQILSDLDSMYTVMYQFNFTDTAQNGTDFQNFLPAIRTYAQAASNQGFDKAYFKSQNIIYLFYRYSDDRIKASNILNQVIEKAKEDGKPVYEAQFTYFKGGQSARYNEYDSALLYFEKSLSIAESINDLQVQAASINALAAIYGELQESEKALTYYWKAFQLTLSSKDSTQMTILLGNIGLTYAKMEVADSALYYGFKEYDLARERQLTGEIFQSLNVITMGSYLKGNYKEALAYSDTLYQMIEPIGDWGFMMTPYLYRSKSWVELGKTKNALDDIVKSVSIAKSIGNPQGEINGLDWLIEVNQMEGDFEQALKNYERLDYLKDSLQDVETKSKADKMALTYELRERETRIAGLQSIQEANSEKLYFRNLMLISLGLTSMVAIILIIILYKRKVEKEQNLAQESKNQLLRSQLNPHFLFNALSSIQMFLINKGQGIEALEYLSKFAKLMRRILENSRENYVSLEDEVITLRHYLDLQKIRFDNKFNYQIEIETDSSPSEIMIPPMFAQPFIENSLEHGISEKEDGRIEINFSERNGFLKFRVEDNGVGITRSTKLKENTGHKSLATIITQDRIELLRKQLKKNIGFSISDRQENGLVIGTKVLFELPITYKTI